MSQPLIIHVIVDLDVGGAELMLKRLVQSSGGGTRFRHMVVSLTTIGSVGRELQALGVNVESLGLGSIFEVPLVIWKLAVLFRKYRPQIVQTWMYHADFLGGLAACLVGSCAVVWGIRSTAVPQGPLSATYWLVRLCAILSRIIPCKIICNSNSGKLAHIKLGYPAAKMTVINNGFQFSVFDQHLVSRMAARKCLGFEASDIIIGVVGRFDPLKDFPNLITAAATMAIERTSIKFLMVGRNLDWSNDLLRGWIETVGLESHFKLVGEQLDVPFFLSAMDIFCLSSRTEAFPNVVVEAMAMSLALVVTEAGDAKKIVGEYGFVVPVNDSVALAGALLKMCELGPQERRKLGEKAEKKVRAEYDIENIRRNFEDTYQEVLQR